MLNFKNFKNNLILEKMKEIPFIGDLLKLEKLGFDKINLSQLPNQKPNFTSQTSIDTKSFFGGKTINFYDLKEKVLIAIISFEIIDEELVRDVKVWNVSPFREDILGNETVEYWECDCYYDDFMVEVSKLIKPYSKVEKYKFKEDKGFKLRTQIRTLIDIQRWDLLEKIWNQFDLFHIIKNESDFMGICFGNNSFRSVKNYYELIKLESHYDTSIVKHRIELFEKNKKSVPKWFLKFYNKKLININ